MDHKRLFVAWFNRKFKLCERYDRGDCMAENPPYADYQKRYRPSEIARSTWITCFPDLRFLLFDQCTGKFARIVELSPLFTLFLLCFGK